MISMQGEGVGWQDRPHLGVVGTVTVMDDIGNSTQNSTRPLCACGNKREWKERRKDGSVRYRGVCETCRKERNGWVRQRAKKSFVGEVALRKELAQKCSICGWEGPCDLHRLIAGKDGGKYVKGNISVLCPNCHRLAHRGLLKPLPL